MECQQSGVKGLGIGVESRTLGGLRGNMTSAESSGVQDPQAAENWTC